MPAARSLPDPEPLESVMVRTLLDDFVLFGSLTEGELLYVCRPGPDRNTWVSYQVRAGGRLADPKIVFGGDEAGGWRGLPVPAAEGE